MSDQHQPQYAWAPPSPSRWVESPPLEYHQLLRGTARYRWWKPLLALVLGAIYYLVFSLTFGVLVIVPYLLLSGVDPLDPGAVQAEIFGLALPDTQNPASMLLALGSIALMIPAAQLAMLSTGLGPLRRLWSVALRIRWRWIWRSVVPAIMALVVMQALSVGFGAIFAPTAAFGPVQPESPPVPFSAAAALWSLALVLLLVPLQSTAEELVYRGMLMQSLGAWLGGVRGEARFARIIRGPWIPITIPAVAFGFSHLYDVWGWIAVVMMALVAGFLSWRTGGLEAAISLHVVNNVVAFGLLASGVVGETGQTSDGGGPAAALATVIALTLYAWWMDRDFRRRDGRRSRVDYVIAEAGAPISADAGPRA